MNNNRFYIISLFDFYSSLLTEKQQKYFMEAYFEDKSLSEIAEIYNVSKNAIHDSLKNIVNDLLKYEEKLKLKYKYDQRTSLIKLIDDKNLREKFLEIEEE